MTIKKIIFILAIICSFSHAKVFAVNSKLDLKGYADIDGAISVLHQGDSADPYFAMQALLLAHDNGLDATSHIEKFTNWLLPFQKPDGTFDRFCRDEKKKWLACKTADADDSILALWMRLLQTAPDKLKASPVLMKSYLASQASLERLFQPSRGIYMVSPVYLHGLFMDNLEVWSLKSHLKMAGQAADPTKLARAINETFWDPVNQKFLVSTQLEQRSEKPVFYPDNVAQIFPLMVQFSPMSKDARSLYRQWMATHRADWLKQSQTDYPWGLIAVLALRFNDITSVKCWLREAAPNQHSHRWAVTDETAYQIVKSRGLIAATTSTSCK